MPNIRKPTTRERILSDQTRYLSPDATIHTRGRADPLPPCDFRTEFQRDRDRITHSSSFRRLMHKTQVFLNPHSEHFRTRLTHTLEVAQIARTIARALSLNEDLTEAAALGHDLGHTPFGHDGETMLNELLLEAGAGEFRHNSQSQRVVDILTKNSSGGRGLNLTYEVRDGIRNHRGGCTAATPEGEIVKFADKIAYLNHDTEDAEKAGMRVNGTAFTQNSLPREVLEVLGNSKSARITTLIADLAENSTVRPPAGGERAAAVITEPARIRYSPRVAAAHHTLREFMYRNVYNNPAITHEREKAKYVVRELFRRFTEQPRLMPEFYQSLTAEWGIARSVADYIAGMTDSFALEKFKQIVLPRRF